VKEHFANAVRRASANIFDQDETPNDGGDDQLYASKGYSANLPPSSADVRERAFQSLTVR